MYKNKQQALLLLTHKLDDAVFQLYADLKRGFDNFGDVFFLIHDEENRLVGELNQPCFAFKYKDIYDTNFKMVSTKLVPGSNHFPLILFGRKFPEYSHYWVVEFDVRFNGEWSIFFEDYASQSSDFSSCHIRSHDEEPDWPWWEISHSKKMVPLESRIRSFNTLYRMSSSALKFIEAALTDQWKGHHEVLLPTLLHQNQFTVIDFGGDGKFVKPGYENKYYTSSKSNPGGVLYSGSMRYRPCIGEFREGINKLYHPCK